LERRFSPQEVRKRLNAVLPGGVEIMNAKEVISLSSSTPFPSSTVYRVSLDDHLSKEETLRRIEKALGKKELYIDQERKGKKRRMDIRPLIERMELQEAETGLEEAGRWRVELVLRNEAGGTAKPLEVVGATLGLEGESLSKSRIMKVE
jgi:radical SAM-linked protein